MLPSPPYSKPAVPWRHHGREVREDPVVVRDPVQRRDAEHDVGRAVQGEGTGEVALDDGPPVHLAGRPLPESAQHGSGGVHSCDMAPGQASEKLDGIPFGAAARCSPMSSAHPTSTEGNQVAISGTAIITSSRANSRTM